MINIIRLVSLFLIILFTIIFLIFDKFIKFNFKNNLFSKSILRNRVSSVFGDEFILGSYLSRIMPLVFALAYFGKYLKKYNEPVLIFLSIFCFIIVYLTGERVAIINCFISILFLTIILESKKLIKYVLAFYLFIITYLLFFSNLIINNRIIQSTISQMGLFDDKKYIFSRFIEGYYYTALNMFYANPLLSWAKNYRLNCENPKYGHLLPYQDNCNNHPHNILIQLLAESGIFSSSLFIAFFIWVSFKMIKYLIICLKNRGNDFYKFNFYFFRNVYKYFSPFACWKFF